jgi:hypothetical protein
LVVRENLFFSSLRLTSGAKKSELKVLQGGEKILDVQANFWGGNDFVSLVMGL